jgi:GH15 family glucan-1,4-alpha-glucosidase
MNPLTSGARPGSSSSAVDPAAALAQRRERLAAASVAIIRRHQATSGAYLAAPGFPAYRYSWLRDGAFIADAMSRAGETESAAAFFEWCRAIVEGRVERIGELVARRAAVETIPVADFLHTRYTLGGEEADAEWANHQLDGYGAWLWALGDHLRRSRIDSEPPRFALAVESTARYLLAFWDQPCYDCWEENGEQVHVATLAAISAGLRAASDWPGVAPEVRSQAAHATVAIERRVRSEGVRNGHLVKWLGGTELDASLLFCAVPYRLFAPDDPLMRATVAALEDAGLAHGGVHRHLADVYYGGGEWVLLAALLGSYYVAIGERERAEQQLAWVVAQAGVEDHLPEQVSDHLLHPGSFDEWAERWGPIANPLLWSHAMFLNLHGELRSGE